MNREQIIKALECFSLTSNFSSCTGCYFETKGLCTQNCNPELANVVLKLIKELISALESECDHCACELLDERDKVIAEKERLQDILLQFTRIVSQWGTKNNFDTSEIPMVSILREEEGKIKSHIIDLTVRQMQKKLKEKIHKSVYQYWNENDGGYYLAEDVDDDIDQIAEEMINPPILP